MKERLTNINIGLVLAGGLALAGCAGGGNSSPEPTRDVSYREDTWILTVRDTSGLINTGPRPRFDCYSDTEPIIEGTGIQGDKTKIALEEAACESVEGATLFERLTGYESQTPYKKISFATDYQVTLLEQ